MNLLDFYMQQSKKFEDFLTSKGVTTESAPQFELEFSSSEISTEKTEDGFVVTCTSDVKIKHKSES